MADPLDALRIPVTPVAPDPAFARRLRDDVERALYPTGRPAVSTILTDTAAAAPARATPAAAPVQRGVVPFLIAADARRAIEWYVDALGADLRGEPIVMPDGRIGHSELWLAGGPMYVADESPASHVAAPRPGADASVTLGAEVPDIDAVVARAVARGATLERPVTQHSYGRNAVIRDPFAHRWLFSSPPAPALMEHGDVTYASLWVPDVERAAAFFGAVLGWRFTSASGSQGRQVINTSVPQGLWGGQAEGTLFLAYVADDLTAAIKRVRSAGGEAGAPRREPYGETVDCVDDQGVRFAMTQPPHGARSARPSPLGIRHGDLAYISMEMADATRARAFYSAVFGWSYAPGRAADARNVLEPVPMTGMSGGHDRARIVPLYRVDDVAVAVDRVRAAGGTASEPARQPYGLVAECADDQGTAFRLGQL